MGYLDTAIDNDDGVRVRVVRLGNVGQLSIAEFDGYMWDDASEARLDETGLRALAALALIVAEEIKRDKVAS